MITFFFHNEFSSGVGLFESQSNVKKYILSARLIWKHIEWKLAFGTMLRSKNIHLVFYMTCIDWLQKQL